VDRAPRRGGDEGDLSGDQGCFRVVESDTVAWFDDHVGELYAE
jgi:hypothetical protein